MLADAPRLFVFGLGYVGLHTAVQARGLGWAAPTTFIAPFFFEGGRLCA